VEGEFASLCTSEEFSSKIKLDWTLIFAILLSAIQLKFGNHQFLLIIHLNEGSSCHLFIVFISVICHSTNTLLFHSLTTKQTNSQRSLLSSLTSLMSIIASKESLGDHTTQIGISSHDRISIILFSLI